ncbi:MAG TPA: PEP-CTERM sorting domain-containing protein [Verrucomicrobiae bacterium]|nr:PEP-CTERM sorting domain-containing protein [Verrucomicrobiae bacterium]
MMRKQLAVVALATIVTLGLAASSQASLLFSDGFNYPVGGLSGQGPWSVGGNSAALAVISGNLTYPGLLDLGSGEVQITEGTASSTVATYANQTAGQVWYSFLFDPTGANTGNGYVTAMNGGGGAPNGGTDAIDFYYYASGIPEIRANPKSATAGSATALSLNTTNMIVEEIDMTAHTASMWVNPSSLTFGAGSAPTATASLTGATGATSINDVGFKALTTAGGPFIVDNVLVGQSWADVTPTIPEPSTCLLVGSGLALMLGLIRRRRS